MRVKLTFLLPSSDRVTRIKVNRKFNFVLPNFYFFAQILLIDSKYH